MIRRRPIPRSEQWRWRCPTCGRSGYAEASSFSRCYECDSAGRSGPPLEWENNLGRLLDWTHENAIIRVIEIIEEEIAKANPESAHGKAQRIFGNRILARLKDE